jgi:hypothetical protein
MKKSFENWLWEDLEIEFGLFQMELKELDSWLDNEVVISEKEREELSTLSANFNKYYKNWNEDELKMQFIAPLLMIVDYYVGGYMPFSQRILSVVVKNWELSGRVDWMLSKGKQTPRKPYFFLHEYKREVSADGDPQGQLLAEMFAAQQLNQDNFPVYGCYVVGKDWTFMVLKDLQYAISRPYQANESPDFDIIFKALKQIKNLLPL